jgi:hypothetical protein
MTPEVEAPQAGGHAAQEKQQPETWSNHSSPTPTAPQRLTLTSIRERIARAIYPEGFYFDRDTSREIDRLTALSESRGVRL